MYLFKQTPLQSRHRMFPSLPKAPVYLFSQSLLPPSPQATTDLISVILYVCWAYFRILQHVFDSCCCMYRFLVPFHCWISSSLYQFPPFVYLFACWCTFGLYEHSCVNLSVDMCFHFSWSGREWGHMVTVFNYLSSLQTVFQRNISTNVLLFLILISTVIILLSGHNYLWGYEVPSYCNLDLEFPGGLWYWSSSCAY